MNKVWWLRNRALSTPSGSLTFTTNSATSNSSSAVSSSRAPRVAYSSSLNPAPVPAWRSMNTSWPRSATFAALTGVSPTRRSSILISLGTPIRMDSPHLQGGRARMFAQHRTICLGTYIPRLTVLSQVILFCDVRPLHTLGCPSYSGSLLRASHRE